MIEKYDKEFGSRTCQPHPALPLVCAHYSPACDGDITVVAVTPTGTIPAIWANLRYLSILSLTGNKIKGELAVVVPVAMHLTGRSAALRHA